MEATTEKAKIITLRLDPETAARLEDLSERMKTTKERMNIEALKRYFDEIEEDLEDARIGDEAWAEYVASGRKSIPLEEYARRRGIELDA